MHTFGTIETTLVIIGGLFSFAQLFCQAVDAVKAFIVRWHAEYRKG